MHNCRDVEELDLALEPFDRNGSVNLDSLLPRIGRAGASGLALSVIVASFSVSATLTRELRHGQIRPPIYPRPCFGAEPKRCATRRAT